MLYSPLSAQEEQTPIHLRQRLVQRGLQCLFVVASTLGLSSIAVAGPKEIAWKMHNRLAGVPPSLAVLAQMEDLIARGLPQDAAKVAMDNPYFYNLNLKNWLVPWTNKDQTPRAPLNDYSATMIGMIRDDIPFDQALYGDIIYTGKDGLLGTGGVAIPAYSKVDNLHYGALETGLFDLKANLVQKPQSTLTGIRDTAGVMTTRGFGAEFLDAGTNRRPIRFALVNFMCNDMEQLMDNTRSDFHIRRDVTRSPGGDPAVFRSKCAGCHTGMDPLAGAWAHFDFVGAQVVYTDGIVVEKMNRNAQEFPDGWVTRDDSWSNEWTAGTNARFGWKNANSGEGVNQLGRMFAASDEFARCMAKRVFQKVCLRDPVASGDDMKAVADLANDFAAGGKYSMKSLFADTSAVCLTD